MFVAIDVTAKDVVALPTGIENSLVYAKSSVSNLSTNATGTLDSGIDKIDLLADRLTAMSNKIGALNKDDKDAAGATAYQNLTAGAQVLKATATKLKEQPLKRDSVSNVCNPTPYQFKKRSLFFKWTKASRPQNISTKAFEMSSIRAFSTIIDKGLFQLSSTRAFFNHW